MEYVYVVVKDRLNNCKTVEVYGVEELAKTRAEKLGVKYSEIATYMEDKNKLDEETRNKIEKLHNGSKHKFVIPKYELK